jgi:hypothetical protein
VRPAGHDEVRAAAALLALAATWPRGRALRAAVLGADPGEDQAAAIAAMLARWLAHVLRETGTDPREFARQVIADSIAEEAAQAAEDPP